MRIECYMANTEMDGSAGVPESSVEAVDGSYTRAEKMANLEKANEQKAYQQALREAREKAAKEVQGALQIKVTPEMLSTTLDRWLWLQMSLHINDPERPVPPDLMGTCERRAKALGQTQEPVKEPQKADGKDEAIDAVVAAAVNAQKAKKSPAKEA